MSKLETARSTLAEKKTEFEAKRAELIKKGEELNKEIVSVNSILLEIEGGIKVVAFLSEEEPVEASEEGEANG